LLGYIYGEDKDSKAIDVSGDGYYYIPTKEFAKLILENDLSGADVLKIRRMLKEEGILKGNGNRTDVLKRTGDKIDRVLKIDPAKLEGFKVSE
jgi:hypothetical protein